MTATTDDAPSPALPLIPPRLVAALSAWVTLVGIYATIAITQAAVERPMPRMLHSTIVMTLALAAIAWLAVWIVCTIDRHTDERAAALERRLAGNATAIAAVLREVRSDRAGQPAANGFEVVQLPTAETRASLDRLARRLNLKIAGDTSGDSGARPI